MFNKIFSNPVIMTWTNSLVQFGSAIFVLPLILVKFTTEEVAVWFVFNTILGLSMLADSGFGPTTVRSAAYFFSGADILPKNIEEFKNKRSEKGSPNYRKLAALLNTTGRIYLLLSVLASILLAGIGSLVSKNVINLAGNPSDLWIAFMVMVISSGIKIQSVRWTSFIQGIDQVALIRRFESLVGTVRIVLYSLLLILNYKILGLLCADLLLSIATLLYARHFVSKWLADKIDITKVRLSKFDKDIFKGIWPATWRFGGVTWGAYFINFGVSLLVAQINDAALIASFLLTLRVMFVLRQIAQAPLYANLPRVMQMMAKHDFKQLKIYASKGIFLEIFLLISGLVFIGLFGNTILGYMDVKTKLISMDIYFLMSIWLILEIHHAAHSQIYMATNHVPFLLPALLSGIAIVSIGYCVMGTYGLMGLIITQLLVQAACNNWYPVMLSLKLLRWPFKQYLIDVPMYGLQYLQSYVARK